MNPATCEISDKDWNLIQKVLPAEVFKGLGSRGGRPNAELRTVFEANQQDGKVTFDYDTEVYYGRFV